MFRKLISWMSVLISMMASTLGGCMQKAFPEVVEAKDVKFTTRRLETVGGKSVLHIGGFVFHSALGVRTVAVAGDPEAPNVMVYLTPAKQNVDGNFLINVPLQSPKSTVTFGNERTLVWPLENR
jgi:hypothetical protein